MLGGVIRSILNMTAPPTADFFMLLNTMTASNSTSLDDASSIGLAYDLYFIEIENLVPVNSGVNILVRISTDAGLTWKSSNYLDPSGNTDGIYLNVITAVDNINGAGISSAGYLSGPNQTDRKKMIWGNSILSAGSTAVGTGFGGWWNAANTAVNGIRVIASSGNLSTGKVRLYGIAT